VSTLNPLGSCGQLPPGGGNTAVTVTVAVPLLPSLVAVIVVVPARSAVTRPLADTVATFTGLDAQLIVRPLSTLPLESRSVAVNGWVPPIVMVAEAGLNVTDATGFGAPAAVVPLPTFDNVPNTASTPSVPRKATSWKP